MGAGRLADAARGASTTSRPLRGPHGRRARERRDGGARSGSLRRRAVVAFAEGRYADVVDELWPIRADFQRFGGSHAQRDVLQRTLLEAAIRGGHFDVARALVAERLSLRDTSVYGLQRQALLLNRTGAVDAAVAAEQRAAQHQARFSAAAVSDSRGHR